METIFKKAKYKFIVPILIAFNSFFHKKKTKNTDRTFFILGSGRNGSTLLALILNRHSDIFLPPEQYVLPYSIMSWYITPFNNWKSYCKKHLKYYKDKNQDWLLKSNDFDQIFDSVSKSKKKSPSFLFTNILNYYSFKYNKKTSIVGDHSPISTVFYKCLYKEFPKSKFVFLIRNPLDVILSYSKIKNNPASNPMYSSWKWNNSIKAYDYLLKKGCDIHIIKYEDLVLNSEQTVNQLLCFLNLKVEKITQTKSIEKNEDMLSAGEYIHHQNLYKPISNNSIDKWKKELNKQTYKKVLPIIRQNAIRFGYDLNY